jgi:hypothetical protein
MPSDKDRHIERLKPLRAVLPKVVPDSTETMRREPLFRFGLPGLDPIFAGVVPRQLVLVAGAWRPAEALVAQAIRRAAEERVAVLLLSPGAPATLWAEWLLSSEAGLRSLAIYLRVPVLVRTESPLEPRCSLALADPLQVEPDALLHLAFAGRGEVAVSVRVPPAATKVARLPFRASTMGFDVRAA